MEYISGWKMDFSNWSGCEWRVFGFYISRGGVMGEPHNSPDITPFENKVLEPRNSSKDLFRILDIVCFLSNQWQIEPILM
ncbi:hypothetical protein CEXT_436211 [Caerostris extrusa]|uniref:Uncharacterized protein n=1 Tax=Caerostris extrusa TaxID=172846 RepID=A0AAV4XG72_CAEEX|nr:hypothetical protein CEXT_436211 [Caerostris extrusa]